MIDGEVAEEVDGVHAAVGRGEGNHAQARGERRRPEKLPVASLFVGQEEDRDREGATE